MSTSRLVYLGVRTAKTVSGPGTEQLLHRLRGIRKLGYSISDEDVTPGIAALGAPIFDYQGTIRAALSISGVRSAILEANTESIHELIVAAACNISRGAWLRRRR